MMTKDKPEKKEKKEKKGKQTEDVADVDMADAEVSPSLWTFPFDTHIQSPKKTKKEKGEVLIPVEDLSPLARPLAQRKLLKKLHKTIKKGTSTHCVMLLFKRTVVLCSIQIASSEARGEGSCQRHSQRGEGVSTLRFSCLTASLIYHSRQPSRPSSRYQPDRYNIPSTDPFGRGPCALYFCYVQGGARECKLDKKTHQLCNDLPTTEAQNKKGG